MRMLADTKHHQPVADTFRWTLNIMCRSRKVTAKPGRWYETGCERF